MRRIFFVGIAAPFKPVMHGLETEHDLRSTTKSVTRLLIGLAHDRKLIPSLDDLWQRNAIGYLVAGLIRHPRRSSVPVVEAQLSVETQASTRHLCQDEREDA